MNRKLSEEDVKMRYITPALLKSGWEHEQIACEYYFTDGRITVRGKITSRGKRKFVDYLLSYNKNQPIALIEAKDMRHSMGSGMQQAVGYANSLDVKYVYTSNGQGFKELNLITGVQRELTLDEFPSPEELYNKYLNDMGISKSIEKVIEQPYHYAPEAKTPRYYQQIAINRAVNAIAGGQDRALLVCATGTGKTYMSFQIIYRLWKAGIKKKILFLADRNVLIDQTISGDFKPFGRSMTKITNRNLDSSYEIYLGLYQQLSGEDGEEIFREFKPDFFDLIVIDECHRGSSKEDSTWRKILDYFSSATHLGCTATPVETNEASNQTYFGKPIYEYSLKQGIDDGFLAPYKVIRVGLDKDLEGFRPEHGQTDKYGFEIKDREYCISDYDRKIVLENRTKVVAKKVTEFLRKNGRMSKTIVFCIDIEHADRMREALIAENRDEYVKDNRYIMKITGDDNEGKAQLENFIDEDSTYPVIAVTSKLMTTGVDAKMCKLIVLDNNIASMTEFKQIIGRGTRLLEEYGKTYFTIMDFRNVSRLFADEKFDGKPEVAMEIDINKPIDDDENYGSSEDGSTSDIIPNETEESDNDNTYGPKKYYINDVAVTLISERVQYIDGNGNLITESLVDYTKKNIIKRYANLNDFLGSWSNSQRKQAIIEELQTEGVFFEEVKKEINKPDIDDFDLICHLAYDRAPLTKQERTNNVKKRHYLYKYSEVAQKVLEILLDKYMNEGIGEIEDTKVLTLKEFQIFGSPMKITTLFGGKEGYLKAVRELEEEIYSI